MWARSRVSECECRSLRVTAAACSCVKNGWACPRVWTCWCENVKSMCNYICAWMGQHVSVCVSECVRMLICVTDLMCKCEWMCEHAFECVSFFSEPQVHIVNCKALCTKKFLFSIGSKLSLTSSTARPYYSLCITSHCCYRNLCDSCDSTCWLPWRITAQKLSCKDRNVLLQA